jgi:hypothetical protein
MSVTCSPIGSAPRRFRTGICNSLREDRRASRIVWPLDQWNVLEAIADENKISFAATVRMLVDRGLAAKD